ncbi:MAG: hypothetical protein Q8M46_01700, partial [Thiobacillus sp.]|nr:hypothetical protein [Thiobacillus sp.]
MSSSPACRWHNRFHASWPTMMTPDRFPSVPPDTFALHEGELLALQVQAAAAAGLPDVHFHDRQADGSAAPELVVIPAGSFEY